MIGKNNPFNIRYSKKNNWYGQTGRCRGFAEFNTFDNGMRAGLKLLVNYVRHGFNTIDEIINRFAPPCENNTQKYIAFVKQSPLVSDYSCGVTVDTYFDVCVIAQRILLYENAVRLDIKDISFYMKSYVLPYDVDIFAVIPCVQN